MASDVEKIKEKLDIAELVGSYVKLQKAGVNHKALCPFHSEKTPSFYVTPSRQIWHCFGCNSGGDIFRFVQNIEGVEFPEALRILAEKAGVVLERQDPKLRSERTRMLDLLDAAALYYEKNLYGRRDVGAYLKERGLMGETAKAFRLGYAPNSWDTALNHLKEKGFKSEEIEKAGLAINNESRFHDRFRARIMFPFFDSAGRIVGFSGRIFEKDLPTSPQPPAPSPQIAKYINTPQTLLYDKSRVLYGFDRAKTEIRKKNEVVVLEGQMDLLMSHQSGVLNSVAVSGTALTSHHLVSLKRLCETIAMSFDMDDAGFEATKKSVELATAAGFDVKIVSTPGTKDPADLIKENPEAWLGVLKEAKPVVSFFLEALKQKYTDMLDFKKEAGRIVLPYISSMPNELVKAHWVGEFSKAVGVREENIWQEMTRLKTPAKKNENADVDARRRIRNRRTLLEERLIGMAGWKAGDLSEKFAECGAEWFSIQRRGIFEQTLSKQNSNQDHYVKKLALEAELLYASHDDLASEITSLAKELRKECLKEKLAELGESVRKLEASGDKKELEEKFAEFQAASVELNSI